MEIKFRGKCLGNGEWVYGDKTETPNGKVFIVKTAWSVEHNYLYIYRSWEVDPKTVGIASTKKDNYNGQHCALLWQGDIVRNDFVGDLWEVIFTGTKFVLGLIPNSGLIKHPITYPMYVHLMDLDDMPECFHKIGNIWEVPK